MKAVSILTCGADPTAQRLSTSAIQQAINSAQQNDVIVIPQGRFLTGALFLKTVFRFAWTLAHSSLEARIWLIIH